jgi:hypothetical protein
MKIGKTKLVTLSLLATIAYIFIILNSLASNWDDFRLGYNDGKSHNLETFYVNLKARDGYTAFPDSIINLNTNNYVNIRHDCSQVRASLPPDLRNKADKWGTLEILLSLFIVIIVIYIPVLFFRLMKSLINDVVFDFKNISRLRKIGYSLLVFYVIDVALNQIYYIKNSLLFDFSGYVIQRESADMIMLLLGIVVLLFAEILTRGSIIKEDQDLTI